MPKRKPIGFDDESRRELSSRLFQRAPNSLKAEDFLSAFADSKLSTPSSTRDGERRLIAFAECMCAPACSLPLVLRRDVLGNEFKGQATHSAEHFGDTRDHWWNVSFLQLMAMRWKLDAVRDVLDVGPSFEEGAGVIAGIDLEGSSERGRPNHARALAYSSPLLYWSTNCAGAYSSDANLHSVAKRLKRTGGSVTFSVSVDRDTKKLLRDVADQAYRGNVSELITQIAQQAARQAAAAELLRLHGRSPMTDEELSAFEKKIAVELARQAPVKKKRVEKKRRKAA